MHNDTNMYTNLGTDQYFVLCCKKIQIYLINLKVINKSNLII